MKKEELLKRFVTFPEDYQLVEMTDETRNNQKVTILRFQKDGLFRKNGPRIIGIFAGTTLVSLKKPYQRPSGEIDFNCALRSRSGGALFQSQS